MTSANSAQSFGPERRIRKPKEFSDAFKQGRRLGDAVFGWVVTPAESSESPRLGLAISKKCDVRAVQRNRIKRVVREWFRHVDLPPVDLVVIGRPKIGQLDNAALRQSLDGLRGRLLSKRGRGRRSKQTIGRT